KLPRWQSDNHVASLTTSPGEGEKSKVEAPQVATKLNAPPPPSPFTDFRYEKPGKTRKITVKDIPPPFVTPSAGNGPKVVPRPANAWPQVPPGFKVELFASGLHEPRLIRRAPNGDMFVAESNTVNIKIFRGITSSGKPEQMVVYASGIRNAVGLAIQPKTGDLWCSTNERDGLGDNVVPDYITHVQDGGFYGWPWWYMGGHQDPRHKGKHPELKDKIITPDVLLQ